MDEEGVEMRVVRGFKATLEDELAIVPFILLRVHQSYEDGWSLCSNPGTKERGVVPRTFFFSFARCRSVLKFRVRFVR